MSEAAFVVAVTKKRRGDGGREAARKCRLEGDGEEEQRASCVFAQVASLGCSLLFLLLLLRTQCRRTVDEEEMRRTLPGMTLMLMLLRVKASAPALGPSR